jgi:hypothetical protein
VPASVGSAPKPLLDESGHHGNMSALVCELHAMVSDDDVTGPQLVRDRHSNFHPLFGSNRSLSLDCAPSRAPEPHHSDGGADEQDLSHSDPDDIIAVGDAPVDQCGEHQHGG